MDIFGKSARNITDTQVIQVVEEGAILNHNDLLNKGANAHSVLDAGLSTSIAHIADGTKHFLEGSISHLNIADTGTNSHIAIDSHIADGTKHFLEGSISHLNIADTGTNSHTTIDSHIADGTKHFLEGSINHANIIGAGINSHATIDQTISNFQNHTADEAQHRTINDGGLLNIDLWSGQKINDENYATRQGVGLNVTTGAYTLLTGANYINTSDNIKENTRLLDVELKTTNDTAGAHIGDDTIHRIINDASTLTTELYSASKINSENIATRTGAGLNVTTGAYELLSSANYIDLSDNLRESTRILDAELKSLTLDYDGHAGNNNIHLTQASIDHNNILNRGTYSHNDIDSHLNDVSKHRIINDASTLTTELYSASKINSLIAGLTTFDQTLNTTDTVSFNTVIAGNLTVNGTTTTIDSTIVEVKDSTIHTAYNNPGDTLDSAYFMEYNDGAVKYAGLVRDATDAKFYLFKDSTVEPSSAINYTDLADLNVGSLIVSGTVDGVDILARDGVLTSHIADGAIHRVINDSGTLSTELFSAQKINSEITDIQTGTGLQSDSSYLANAVSNYLTTAIHLQDADNLLDGQIKLINDKVGTDDGIATLTGSFLTGAQIPTAITDHLADDTKHRLINDAGTTTTELFSASKINSLISGITSVGVVTNTGISKDNGVARFDTTTGQIIQDSAITIDDNKIIKGQKMIDFNQNVVLTADPAVPSLTSNNDGSGYIVSSYSSLFVGTAHRVFKVPADTYISATGVYNDTTGVYEGTGTTTANVGAVVGEWIQLQYPSAVDVAQYSVANGYDTARTPNTWHLLYSNDGTTWTSADNRTSVDFIQGVKQSFNLAAPVNALYFRFVVQVVGNSTDTSGRNALIMTYMGFRGLDVSGYSTTQRNALIPVEGQVIYNNTTKTLEVYNGGYWAQTAYTNGTSTNNAIVRYNETGKIQNSGVLIDDSNAITGVSTLTTTTAKTNTLDTVSAVPLSIGATTTTAVNIGSATIPTTMSALTTSGNVSITGVSAFKPPTLTLTEMTDPKFTVSSVAYNSNYDNPAVKTSTAWKYPLLTDITPITALPTNYTGLRAWYDASDTATITTSGTDLTAWNDKSGNALHLIDKTGTITSGVNTFNGLNIVDMLGTITRTGGVNYDNHTIIIACKATSGTDIFGKFLNGDVLIMNAGDKLRPHYRDGTGAFNSFDSDVSIPTATPFILCQRMDATTLTGFADITKKSIATTTGRPSLSIGPCIGGRGPLSNCSIYEVIIFETVLTDTEVNEIGTYLKNKWAITSAFNTINPVFVVDEPVLMSNINITGTITLPNTSTTAVASSTGTVIYNTSVNSLSYNNGTWKDVAHKDRYNTANSSLGLRNGMDLSLGAMATGATGFTGVAWSPKLGIFCAVKNSSVQTSSNGVSWAIQTIPGTPTFAGIFWMPDPGRFVLLNSASGTACVYESADGLNFYATTTPSEQLCSAGCYSPELQLAVVGGLTSFLLSSNGVNWTSTPAITDKATKWTNICWSGKLGIFVALASFGNTFRIAVSPNAVDWADYAIPADIGAVEWTDIVYSYELNLFVAVNATSVYRIMVSKDGMNWEKRVTPERNWQNCVWSPSLSLFVCASGTENYGMKSPDGYNWTEFATPSVGGAGLAWSPELGIFSGVSGATPVVYHGNRIKTNSLIVYDDFSWNIPHAEIIQGTPILNTGTATWTKVNFTSTVGLMLNLFTHTTPNRITYTGVKTRMFHTGVTISITPSSNSTSTFEFAVYKNGVQEVGSVVALSTTANGDAQSTAIHKMVTMNTNDYIEIWHRRTVGATDFTMNYLNFFAMAMANY